MALFIHKVALLISRKQSSLFIFLKTNLPPPFLAVLLYKKSSTPRSHRIINTVITRSMTWTSLVLLLSLTGSALGAIVPLVVYKQTYYDITFYRYKMDKFSESNGYDMINGQNKKGDEFTYVKAYDKPERSGYDSFDREISICRLDFDNNREKFSTHMLSGAGCSKNAIHSNGLSHYFKSISDTKQRFFVSRRQPRHVRWMRVSMTLCRPYGRFRPFVFTSLTEGNAYCPTESFAIYSETFYVVAHNGIACPDFKTNIINGLAKKSYIVDGVFPSRLTLECRAGFKAEGRSAVSCTNGRWSSSSLGTCRRMTCGCPGPLIRGWLSLNGTAVGDVAIYKCDKGYKLIGPSRRICTNAEKWMGRNPYCTRDPQADSSEENDDDSSKSDSSQSSEENDASSQSLDKKENDASSQSLDKKENDASSQILDKKENDASSQSLNKKENDASSQSLDKKTKKTS